MTSSPPATRTAHGAATRSAGARRAPGSPGSGAAERAGLPWGAFAVAALGVSALLALLVSLVVGGAAAAPLVLDPGPVVRYGLPIAKLATTLGASAAIGALLLSLLALARDTPAHDRALDVAAAGAALWALGAVATGFFIFLSIFLEPITLDDRFGQLLASFFTERELGQAWLATALMAAVVTVLCFAVRSPALLAGVLALAVAAVWPVAQTGHAGGTADHDAAVTAVYLHSVFAAVWVGGLLTLVLARRALGDRLGAVLARYSTLALIAFIVVAASGLVSAQIRVGTLEGLASPYGALLIAKVVSLIALGAFGAVYRGVLIARVQRAAQPRASLWAIVVAELVVMGAASGIATALARTAPPVEEVPAEELADPTPAELLTGSPLPPPFEPWRLATEWDLNLLWALLAVFGAFFYLAGAWRLHRRGDRWPVHRTILWVTGMAMLFAVTSGGFAVYEPYLFSVHMLGHMLLSMAIPVLLVLAAPVTLAARAIHARTDGSRGPREWILAIVHSRFAGIVGHPLVAAVVFAVSLLAFYYSPLFSWAVTDHVGHQWMILHFLLSGFLFVNALIGIDPAPYRPAYPIRLLILMATMAFHAFFGLFLLTGTGLLLPEWYGAMGREWGQAPLADQQTGGGIAWSVGEIPTLALALLVMLSWSRSDGRESKRRDRQAERDGDAELQAYNEMLAQRADRASS
ncbi:cytochrome c oxidase assembly protein [Microcella indica]|uniref:cytochrome c oxidase assembly protein n=1 Tax=Microcella indica TaxID=2750620 RepID=UPI0015CF41A6|nr:cytochrome c oxidase assembly protein [Microcella indica]